MRAAQFSIGLCFVALIAACGPSEQERATIAEQRRVECLDKICPGDQEPAYDHTRYQLFKRNGKWFIGPREYGGFAGSFAFYWPSRAPARGVDAEKRAPEFKPGDRKTANNFYDVAIEFFVVGAPAGATGSREPLEKVENDGWVASRILIRPDLEQIKQRDDVPGHERTLYVATELTGLDGKPPVAGCSHDHPSHGGGTSFMWKPGLKVWARWNQRHCMDWPEIYTEIISVLDQVKEVQP